MREYVCMCIINDYNCIMVCYLFLLCFVLTWVWIICYNHMPKFKFLRKRWKGSKSSKRKRTNEQQKQHKHLNKRALKLNSLSFSKLTFVPEFWKEGGGCIVGLPTKNNHCILGTATRIATKTSSQNKMKTCNSSTN